MGDGERHRSDGIRGNPLAVDQAAVSADADLPGFLAPPPGSPVYYGFPVLDDVEVDGFKLGMISNWEAAPQMTDGDAFVVAPDDSRCGLNWYVSAAPIFREVLAPDAGRWGVWDVSFTRYMTSRADARNNLAEILPHLKPIWVAWRKQFRPNAAQ